MQTDFRLATCRWNQGKWLNVKLYFFMEQWWQILTPFSWRIVGESQNSEIITIIIYGERKEKRIFQNQRVSIDVVPWHRQCWNMLVQWLVLLPHSKKVPASNRRAPPCRVRIFSLGLHVFQFFWLCATGRLITVGIVHHLLICGR